MEPAHTPDESTPLIGNTSATNRPWQPYGISATSSELTPLSGSSNISNGQAPLDDNGAEEQSPSYGPSLSFDSEINPFISRPRTLGQETNEVSLEVVVEALSSAWQRNRKPRLITLEFFTTKDLCAMHLAWKNITTGRHCSSKPHEIAEALASAIGKCIFPRLQGDYNEDDEDLTYYLVNTRADQSIIAANLLREWERITEGEKFPVRYIETVKISEEPPDAVSEFWCRQVELYDKVHDFFLNPKLQAILHSLLIIWPISNLIVGSRYMECPMDYLPYLLMALGCIGCFAILVRLALMYLTSKARNPHDCFREWIVLRIIELTFLIIFIVEASFFFKIDPATESESNQCGKFYVAALVLNYMSISLATAYVLAYSIKICVNQLDVWHWIFTHL